MPRSPDYRPGIPSRRLVDLEALERSLREPSWLQTEAPDLLSALALGMFVGGLLLILAAVTA